MARFLVSFPATSTNYSCTSLSFFTRNYLLALQEYNEAILIEPGYNYTSVAEFLEWKGAPLPLASSTRESFRNLTEGSRQLDCSKSVKAYLTEVTASLGPLTINLPTRKWSGSVSQEQDHKLYDLTVVCGLPLLLEPLILKKEPLKFFSPDNCSAKTLPFVTIEDPFDATDFIQDLKPCLPVIDPHFDPFRIRLDTISVWILFVPIPDMEMTPLLFFESKSAPLPSREPQKLQSPPTSIVKPTVVTENTSLSPKQSEIIPNCLPETTEWPELPDPVATLPFSNENLQFFFPDWDDIALEDLLRIEHAPVVSSMPELNQTSQLKPSTQALNLLPPPKLPEISQAFLLASKKPASCAEKKSVTENGEETVPETVVEDRTIVPSKLKAFISRTKSRKLNHVQNMAPPVRLVHKDTPIPSKEDLIIVEIPAAGQLLHFLHVLQTAGAPLLLELLETNLRLPRTFRLVKPEHTRTFVRQIYEQRRCKTTSGNLSKEDDRVYGVVVALHGLVKTADVMVNCDIDLGLTVFETFKASYAENFGFSDWIQVVTQVLTKNKRIEAPLHPKMVQLCQIVEQYEASRGRILVSFNRHATELQNILTRTLAATKITCLPWEDNQRADIYWTSTQNTLTAILASEIVLVIYYEDPVGRPGIKQLLLRTIWGEKRLPEPLEPVRDEELGKIDCEELLLEPERKKKKPKTIRSAFFEEQEALKAVLAKITPNSVVNERQNFPCESKRTKLDCESIQTLQAAFLKPGKSNERAFNSDLERIATKKAPPRPNLPLIFHKRLLDLFERTVVALESKWNCTAHECDYSFMLNDPVAHLRQADIICDGFTSIFITTLEEDAVFERILQLRASTCTLWVLLWGPGLQPKKLTIFMSFAYFLKKNRSEFRLRWQLISSQANLALTVDKAARKAAEETEKRTVNAWREFKCPWNASQYWRVLVKLPCLNAFSAWLLLQRADLRSLVGASLELLISKYPELPSKVLQMFYDVTHGVTSFR